MKTQYITSLIKYAAIVIACYFLFKGCEKEVETKYITFTRTIEIPPISGWFEPVQDPVPETKIIKVIDSSWYYKYQELKTEKEKDSLFEEAITINDYNQTFEDDFQSINVFSKTRGQLLEQSVSYETKSQFVTIKDSVPIPIPKRRLSFTVEGGNGLDAFAPKGKFGLMYQNRKGMAYKGSIDTEKYIWVGIGVPLFEF